MREKVFNPSKNNRLEEINRSRKGIIIDALKSVGIVEIVKSGVLFLNFRRFLLS